MYVYIEWVCIQLYLHMNLKKQQYIYIASWLSAYNGSAWTQDDEHVYTYNNNNNNNNSNNNDNNNNDYDNNRYDFHHSLMPEFCRAQIQPRHKFVHVHKQKRKPKLPMASSIAVMNLLLISPKRSSISKMSGLWHLCNTHDMKPWVEAKLYTSTELNSLKPIKKNNSKPHLLEKLPSVQRLQQHYLVKS